MVALLLDLGIVAVLVELGMLVASAFARRALVSLAFAEAFVLVVPNAYFVLGHGTGGQTIGKRLLGVRVVGPAGEPIGYLRAVGRQAVWYISALLFGVGFAFAAVRRDGRALHDLVAGTRVVRARVSVPAGPLL